MRSQPLLMALATLTPGAAIAAPVTTPLEPRISLIASRVAVDPAGGAAAVIYPAGGAVRLQLSSGAPETVPTGRGALVDGLVLANGQLTVLAQERLGCSELFVAVRDAGGVWTRTPLGLQGSTATIAGDQTGIPAIAARACDGSIQVTTRKDLTTWTPFEVVPGLTSGSGSRVSLAAAGNALLVGVTGDLAAIARRDSATWTSLGLPKSLKKDESVSAVSVAFDSLLRPVVFTTKGPKTRTAASITDRSLVQRTVSRFEGAAWSSITAVPDPVGLIGAGYGFGVLDRSGSVSVEITTTSAPTLVAIHAARVGLGANGTLAQVIAGAKNAALQLGV